MWTAVKLVVQEGPFTSSSQTASVVTGKSITSALTTVKGMQIQEKVYFLQMGKAETHGWLKLGPRRVFQCQLLCFSNSP